MKARSTRRGKRGSKKVKFNERKGRKFFT